MPGCQRLLTAGTWLVLSWPCRAALGSPDLQALMMMSFPWSQACRIPRVSLGKVLLPGSGGQGKPCRGSEVTAGFQLPSPDAPCLAQKLSRLHKSILQTANPWWPSHKWVLKGHNPAGWLFCSLGLGVWRAGRAGRGEAHAALPLGLWDHELD